MISTSDIFPCIFLPSFSIIQPSEPPPTPQLSLYYSSQVPPLLCPPHSFHCPSTFSLNQMILLSNMLCPLSSAAILSVTFDYFAQILITSL